MYSASTDLGKLDPPAAILSVLFPWVEAEVTALDSRYDKNKLALDTALKQLLKVFIFFRRVLVQDAAVLYTKNPHASLFKYAPFNSTSFRLFALESTSSITKVETDARLALKDVPENIAIALRGAFEGFAYEQQWERNNTQHMFGEISSGLAQVAERLAETSHYRPSKSRRSEVAALSCPVPLLPSLPPQAPLPLIPTPMSLPQNFGLLAPSPFVAPPLPTRPSLPSPQSLPGFSNFTINISLTGTIISSSPQTAPVPLPSPVPLSHSPLSYSSPMTNNAFNVPRCPSAPHLSPPPLASIADVGTDADANVPNAKWEILCQKFSASQLASHRWTWTSSDWLPEYEYPPITQITKVWTEWTDRIGGCLSVEALTKTWGASWHRNIRKLKVESNRRMKIVKLVQELAMRPGWSVPVAVRFLTETYEPKYQARAFSDYLTKANWPVVLAAADVWRP
ncbi:hypothetical protein B0H10DRAFT_1945895 [Mycena sp. CBHHK59/15]|nr:hypothetical protein B0H10DRAFT_1945895 [Mycena sp. CBHHK59/15]